MSEAAGLTGFEVSTWFGLLTPAGLPQSIAPKLNNLINRIVSASLPSYQTVIAAGPFRRRPSRRLAISLWLKYEDGRVSRSVIRLNAPKAAAEM